MFNNHLRIGTKIDSFDQQLKWIICIPDQIKINQNICRINICASFLHFSSSQCLTCLKYLHLIYGTRFNIPQNFLPYDLYRQRVFADLVWLKRRVLLKCMTTWSIGNTFRVTGPLWGESATEQTIKQTIETLIIWYATALYDVTVMGPARPSRHLST